MKAAIWISHRADGGLIRVTVRLIKDEPGKTPTPCVVQITRATLVLGDTVAEALVPAPIDLPWLSQTETRYLQFQVSGAAEQNSGGRGKLTVQFADGTEWTIRIVAWPR